MIKQIHHGAAILKPSSPATGPATGEENSQYVPAFFITEAPHEDLEAEELIQAVH